MRSSDTREIESSNLSCSTTNAIFLKSLPPHPTQLTSPEKYVIIRYNEEKKGTEMRKFRYNFKKMRPRADLMQIYKTAGIDFQFMPEVEDIRQVQANDITIAQMQRVLRRGAARKYPFLSDRKLDSSVAMTMLNYAPATDNEIPVGEIWIYNEDEDWKSTIGRGSKFSKPE